MCTDRTANGGEGGDRRVPLLEVKNYPTTGNMFILVSPPLANIFF